MNAIWYDFEGPLLCFQNANVIVNIAKKSYDIVR